MDFLIFPSIQCDDSMMPISLDRFFDTGLPYFSASIDTLFVWRFLNHEGILSFSAIIFFLRIYYPFRQLFQFFVFEFNSIYPFLVYKVSLLEWISIPTLFRIQKINFDRVIFRIFNPLAFSIEIRHFYLIKRFFLHALFNLFFHLCLCAQLVWIVFIKKNLQMSIASSFG